MLARERILPKGVDIPIESQIRIVEGAIRNLEREIIREQEMYDAETDPLEKDGLDQCITWLNREIEKEEFNLRYLKGNRK
jgi:hypothetical protein